MKLVQTSLLVLALVLAACGASSTTTTSPSAQTTTTVTTTSTTTPPTTTAPTATTTATSTTTTTAIAPEAPESFAVYHFAPVSATEAGPFLTPMYRSTTDVPISEAVEADAVAELLRGPTSAEVSFGAASEIPEGTTVLGFTSEGDGTVTLDLSGDFATGGASSSMFGRLAQVVFTVTQFDEVEAVAFALDGVPVTVFSGEGIELEGPIGRDFFFEAGVLPEIFVDSPAHGAEVSMPITVRGLARVFEATFSYAFVDWDGLIVDESFTMTRGADIGEFGSFEFVIDAEVTPGNAGLIVWEQSAADGSQINVVEYPLTVLGS